MRPVWLLGALLPAAVGVNGLIQPPARAQSGPGGPGASCASPAQVRPLDLPSHAAPAPPPPAPNGQDYRHLLRPTPAGWPVVAHWCVWIEPADAAAGTGEARRQADWLGAVETALQQWSGLLSISRVNSPEQAQVRVWRRRPPLQRQADGSGVDFGVEAPDHTEVLQSSHPAVAGRRRDADGVGQSSVRGPGIGVQKG